MHFCGISYGFSNLLLRFGDLWYRLDKKVARSNKMKKRSNVIHKTARDLTNGPDGVAAPYHVAGENKQESDLVCTAFKVTQVARV